MAEKLTFTLDPETVQRLGHAAEQLEIPKSAVVREAIAEFYERLGHLSARQKSALLRTFDEVVPGIPERSGEDVDRELAEVRHARKAGGRRTAVEKNRPAAE